MTVMEAERTDATVVSPTPKVDEIAAKLADPVWTLVRAGQVAAAVVLLEAAAHESLPIWREEYLGIPQPPVAEKTTRAGCTSMDHSGLDCPSALAEGLLEEGADFCAHCSEQQRAQEPAPARETATGKVHLITRVQKTGQRVAG